MKVGYFMQYSIHEDNLPKLIEKLKRIENKCSKYGCTFSYAEIGEEFKDIQHYKEIIAEYGSKQLAKTFVRLERFVIVEVEGKAIINDWQFLATLEHTENGNVIRSYSEVDIPEKYKTAKAHCDHCNIDRYRKDSYLILNTVTNEIKQVGKSCLMDYTNGLSAEMAASFASYFNTIAELNDHESLGGFTRHYHEVETYLMYANEIVKKAGFISRQKAEDTFQPSTAQWLRDYINFPDSKEVINHQGKIGFNPDTEENKAEVKTMLEWLKNQSSDSQYINNLKIVCSNKYTENRDVGLLASLPSAYFKAMQIEADKAQKESEKANIKPSEYVGKVNDKISLEAVTITHVAQYETQYGITHIFKIVDSNGNVFVWRTNKSTIESLSEEKYSEMWDKTYRDTIFTSITDFHNIKGTVKEHKEYNGEKQTELTRCKVF
jgi:hypothetical protein